MLCCLLFWENRDAFFDEWQIQKNSIYLTEMCCKTWFHRQGLD